MLLRKTYTAGAATALLLHVPIGIAYITELRAQGPVRPSDWAKTAGVLAVFLGLGVATPHLLSADRTSPHAFTDKQLGLTPPAASSATTAR